VAGYEDWSEGLAQTQLSSRLFDHLVSLCKKRRRKIDAECLGGFEVND
jgi:hypothetical protein